MMNYTLSCLSDLLCILNRIELAKCIANPSCAANIACLQSCNNRPDETECQVSSLFHPCFGTRPFHTWEQIKIFENPVFPCVRSNVGTCSRTRWLMSSMSVQSPERNVFPGSLMLGNFLFLILVHLFRGSTWQISMESGI